MGKKIFVPCFDAISISNAISISISSDFGLLSAVPTRVFPLLSTLLSGHQALDALNLALFLEYDEGKHSEIEGDGRLWTSNAPPVACS